jgi:hypothetical protein
MQDHDDEDPSRPQHEQSAEDLGDPGELPESVERRARERVLRIGAATTAVAVVIVVVTIAISGSVPWTRPARSHGITPARGVNDLLAGIPQSGNTLGSPTAPVTLQYFGDLECSTARTFTLEALPSIIRDWVRPGMLRIEYRSLRSVSEPGVFSVQQVAALAAGMQDKLWYYLEDFYHEQGREHSGYVTEGYLSGLARQVPGLNLKLWAHARHDSELARQVAQAEQAAHTADLYSTPSLLVKRGRSTPLQSFNQSSALDLVAVNEALRQALYSRPTRIQSAPLTAVTAASAALRTNLERDRSEKD